VRIAVQIRELVSSNLNTLVEAAANPAKMLRLMQRELQDCIVALQGDFTRAERRRERRAEEAVARDRAALDWTEKAQVAMSHRREDLARAALLAREQTAADADRARAEAQAAADEARAIAQAIAELEAKLAETDARLAEELARAGAKPAADTTTRSERMLDRVATLERRVDFAAGRRGGPDPASIEAEIAQLQREARVADELAAMKAAVGAAKAPRKPKAKG
jgi:phage shock protein A